MNNLLSYCGLVDAKISASDKDLPVKPIQVLKTSLVTSQQILLKIVLMKLRCLIIEYQFRFVQNHFNYFFYIIFFLKCAFESSEMRTL